MGPVQFCPIVCRISYKMLFRGLKQNASSTICQLGTTKGFVCPFVHSNSVFSCNLFQVQLCTDWTITLITWHLIFSFLLGCSVDVLFHIDSVCSGRRSCTIVIPDATLREMKPCPKDFALYFQAKYSCVKGRLYVFIFSGIVRYFKVHSPNNVSPRFFICKFWKLRSNFFG